MAEPVVPLIALSEAQRAQALERYVLIRPALEEGVTQAQVALLISFRLVWCSFG